MQVLEVISSFFYTPYWIDATHAYTKINGIKKTCVSVLFYNMVVNIPKVMAYQLKVHNYFLLLWCKNLCICMCNKWFIVGKKDANMYY